MKDRWTDALIALVVLTGMEVQLALGHAPGLEPLAVAGAVALAVPIVWRRTHPLAVAAAFAAASALQAALGGGVYENAPPLGGAILAGAVVFYSLGTHAPEREARIGLAGGIAGLWATVVLADHVELSSFLFAGGLVAVTPWLAGRVIRARMLRAVALERAAASEERQRIARELHDVVAHGVVLMVLQAQGARRILDQDPARARRALEAIEETGRTALEEIRG